MEISPEQTNSFPVRLKKTGDDDYDYLETWKSSRTAAIKAIRPIRGGGKPYALFCFLVRLRPPYSQTYLETGIRTHLKITQLENTQELGTFTNTHTKIMLVTHASYVYT